ncbi:N-acetylmuramoyl-L-alanine amidase [Allorhizobium sp. BGMRC 0089]|nr:N-acetylmuramoyl-L-alanine amidase [Allorhizobium sonneratiae]
MRHSVFVMVLRGFCCFALMFAAAFPALADMPLAVTAARVASNDARGRLVFDFDRKPDATVHYIGHPDRVVIDLPATDFTLPQTALQPVGLFRDIRYGAIDASHARIVLNMSRPAKVMATDVAENGEGGGYRLTIDAEMTDQKTFDKLVAAGGWNAAAYNSGRQARLAQDPPPSTGKFVIAVDPGHGGIDTGAISLDTHVPEKRITLAFGKAFAAALNKQPGIEAFLTRDTDRYLSLPERVTIARQKGANLFISLHADMLDQPSIRGATVYTLSDKASDHLAAEAADRENKSDEIGGVTVSHEPEAVNDILQDLTRRETQAFSISLANAIVSSFKGQVNLINNPHRSAGFRVLQSDDVPSVLIELGFLSNRQDEKLLLDPAWRAKVVSLLVEAVKAYRAPLVAGKG